jgi:acetyl esterase/lipase
VDVLATRRFVADGFNLPAAIKAGIADPKRIGIQGQSQGGLLTWAALAQRPDLYKAAVIGLPVLDLERLPTLTASDIGKDEYGDPTDAKHRAFMKPVSPYHIEKRALHIPGRFSLHRPKMIVFILLTHAKWLRAWPNMAINPISTKRLNAGTA